MAMTLEALYLFSAWICIKSNKIKTNQFLFVLNIFSTRLKLVGVDSSSLSTDEIYTDFIVFAFSN